MYKIKILYLFLLVFLFGNISAQDFEVAPVKMIFKINPGETQTKILTIKNHSNFKTPFNITFEDFIFDKDGNKISMKRNSSKSSCSEWITPEQTFFDINPNELIELKISMHAPDGDFTTRWAMMHVQTARVQSSFDTDKTGIGAGVNLSGRIAVQIYRESDVKEEPKVNILNLREIINPDKNERKFLATIDNKGDVIAKCKVIFIASDLSTGEEIELEPVEVNSYPGYQRDVSLTLPSTMPPGQYSFVALLDYGKTTTIKGTRLKETLIILPQKEDSDD